MRFRKKIKKKYSKKLFRKTAQKVHKRNGIGRVMRGGYRI